MELESTRMEQSEDDLTDPSDVEDSKNHHFCKCLQCSEVKRRYQEMLDETSSEESNSE